MPLARPRRTSLACALFLVLVPATRADEPGPAVNPVYRSWARFKLGASVTYRSVTRQKTASTEMSLTYTLTDRTPERVVVESVVRMTVNGKEVTMPASRLVNLKSSGASAPGKVGASPPSKQAGLIGEGTETLPIAGRTIATRWTKVKARSETAENVIQTWSSDDVPGGLVKSVTTVPGSVAGVTMDLTAITTP